MVTRVGHSRPHEQAGRQCRLDTHLFGARVQHLHQPLTHLTLVNGLDVTHAQSIPINITTNAGDGIVQAFLQGGG